MASTKAAAVAKRVGLSAGLWAAGDATCQLVVPSIMGVPAEPYDIAQTGRQALYGGLFMATAGHGFYGGIEKLLPGSAMKSVVGKVLADQLIFAPALLTGLFYSMARLEGQPHAVGADRVASTLLPALQMNWTVWPLITALNQTIVPVAQRVTVVNLVCIPWTAYLAYKNCKAKQEEVATAEKDATDVKL